MTDTHVVSALKTKRIQIASQIEHHREQMRLAVIALVSVVKTFGTVEGII